MANTCNVPKDLSNIKTKIALSLTKRQLICFGGAAMTGLPFYFFTKPVIGIQAASLLMVGIMLPFFFVGMFERDGFPAEKILYHIFRQKILYPGIRLYKTENVYRKMEKEEKRRKEAACIEEEKYEKEVEV